jgi:hypothetical protein
MHIRRGTGRFRGAELGYIKRGSGCFRGAELRYIKCGIGHARGAGLGILNIGLDVSGAGLWHVRRGDKETDLSNDVWVKHSLQSGALAWGRLLVSSVGYNITNTL